MSHTNPSNAGPSANDRRKRRWKLPVAIVALLAVGGAVFLASRPWFIMAVIEPELERMLGGEVAIDHAHWSGLGQMELLGVSVRVPSHDALPEPAGEVAHIGRATIEVKLLPLAIGRLLARSLAFEDVVLRLVEDTAQPGRFTFFELDPRINLKSRRGAHPPLFSMRNVTLESGEYDDDGYAIIGRRRVAGSMEPMAGDDSTFTFTLTEVDGQGQFIEDGWYIHGRWDATTLSHAARLDGLVLDEQTLAMCPKIVRLWWNHMDLSGRVAGAKIDWTIGESFIVELEIEQVDLTLPDQVEAFLVRYDNGHILEHTDRPRMELHSGVIRWEDERLDLIDLEGRILSGDMREDELVHLPYRISVSIDELPVTGFDRGGEWLRHALEVAPFHMQIETAADVTDRRDAEPDAPPRARAVDLPLPVAHLFEQLQLSDWSIDTQVEISRAPARMREDGTLVAAPVQWRGDLNIINSSLRPQQFDYPLRNVDAALRIEQNIIHIEEFHARGMEESRFTLDGRIILPPDAPGEAEEMGYDFGLVAVHLPLDETLLAALPEHNRGFFDSLFARSLYESYKQAGLIGGETTKVSTPGLQSGSENNSDLEARLIEIERTLDAADPADDVRTALQRERDQLIAQLKRGPIRLSGNLHLDLRIRRDVGPNHRDTLTGTIEPDRVGIIFDRFPYPFTIVGGKLEWSQDRVTIVNDELTSGLSIVLPGGGRGTIAGRIDRPRIEGVRRMHPELRFELYGEPVNDLLAAAIPLTEHDREHLPDADQWPGSAIAAPARLLQSIGLRGTLRSTGRIITEAVSPPGLQSGSENLRESSHRITYHFDIHLEHGFAEPNAQLVEHIGAAGLFWPDGFAVRNVQGHLSVSPERIDLRGFHGWHDPGEVLATGAIDRAAEPTTIELEVTLSDLDLHESIINLVPREGLDMARALWDRYQPHGRFTAGITFRETGEVRHPVELVATPTICHIQLDGEGVSFTHQGGHLAIRGGDEPIVGFEQLHVSVHQGESDHGDLNINGAYGMTPGVPFEGENPNPDDNPLHITGRWIDAAVESPVIPEILRLIGAEGHQQWFADHSPRGRVDAAFEYRSAPRVADADTPEELGVEDLRFSPPALNPEIETSYWLSITPRELAFMLNETPIAVAFDPNANVLLNPGHLQLNNLAGRMGDSAFRVHGDVAVGEAVDATLDIDFRGHVSSDEVLALFPAAARNVLEQLEFEDGRFTEVQQSRLELYGKPSTTENEASSPEFDWEVVYHGQLFLNDASMQIGVPTTEINGAMDVNLHVIPNSPPQLTMSAAFDSLRIIDRLITDVRADEIKLNDDAMTVMLPEIRGQSYGGVVLAEATVGVGKHDRYEMQVELAGLALSDLYADHTERLVSSNGERAGGRARSPRGEVFGGVKLAGQHGRPESRSGRGTIRAVGGNLESIPMVLQVFQVLQMTIPLRGSLDQANADFYIDGDQVIFETILFESTVAEQFAVFQLLGHGRMNLNTFELNTRFRSRGGMLLLRDLAGGLGDHLYVIEVTGTPANPKARVLPLPWLLQPFSQPTGLGAAPTDP